MLATLQANAERLGLEVETVRTEAERLPFESESFDLVLGHAVLHHIPDLDQAAGEFLRVLRPGGTAAFCGEPSAYGDRLAAVPKRAGALLAPLWRAALARPEGPRRTWPGHRRGGAATSSRARSTCTPLRRRTLADFFERAGFEDVYLRGEELVANLYGWWLRSVEATADPEGVPNAWRRFAFRSYIELQKLDSAVLEPRLPPELFYNLVLSQARRSLTRRRRTDHVAAPPRPRHADLVRERLDGA